jgi:hypothetical protein
MSTLRRANGIETRGSGASSIHRPHQPAGHRQLQVWMKTTLQRPISARLRHNPRAWRPVTPRSACEHRRGPETLSSSRRVRTSVTYQADLIGASARLSHDLAEPHRTWHEKCEKIEALTSKAPGTEASRNALLLLCAQLTMQRYMLCGFCRKRFALLPAFLLFNNVAKGIIDGSSIHRVRPKPDTAT